MYPLQVVGGAQRLPKRGRKGQTAIQKIGIVYMKGIRNGGESESEFFWNKQINSSYMSKLVFSNFVLKSEKI